MTRLLVEEAIRELDEILAADGGRLVLRQATDVAVELELDLSASNCPECVLPKPMLVEIVRSRLATAAPDVREVQLHDPREQESAP